MNLLEKIYLSILIVCALCLIPFGVIAAQYKYGMPLLIDIGIGTVLGFIGLIWIFIGIWKN